MKTACLSLFLIIGMTSCRSQNYTTSRPGFVIYDGDGDRVSYERLLKRVEKTDVCLFGELHNDPISHWMELTLLEDLHEEVGDRLIAGAEMWERDNQNTLDEFLVKRFYGIDTYIENSRMWPNFTTDYLPILRLVSDNDIRFVATNVPRRYANMVSDKGFGILDSLDSQARSYLAPLPLEVDYGEKVYNFIAESFKQMASMPMKKRDVSRLVEAQVLKDATMAWFITQNRREDDLFFHFHGEMHSAWKSAIAYHIRQYAPKTDIITISVVMAKDVMGFKPQDDRADYYIVVPYNMTKTYAE